MMRLLLACAALLALCEGSLFEMIQKNHAKHGAEGRPICATTEVFYWRKLQANVSMYPQESGVFCGENVVGCDDPNVRDLFAEGDTLQVRLAVRVICFENGTCPITPEQIEQQVAQLHTDFGNTTIEFVLDEEATEYFYMDEYAYLPPYGPDDAWYQALMEAKQEVAYSPETHLNVFVTGQYPSEYGVLLGIGTFPWDPQALTSFGGLWVNGAYFGEGQTTATHELGHNLGLWHTFHGVSEVPCTSDCFEAPHKRGASSAALVGDFIETTQATPLNYECLNPSEDVCSVTSWNTGSPDWKNFLSYSMDDCMKEFEPQQVSRARCILCTTGIVGQTTNGQQICE